MLASPIVSARTPTVVTRHHSALGHWETAVATPAFALRLYVKEYVGWIEAMAAPLVRRELPGIQAPVIIGFGAPIRLFDVEDPTRQTDFTAFVTGAYDTWQLVGAPGPTGGIQVNLTLLGMRRLLGRPLAELHNRAVAIDDVFGPTARSWPDQLASARTWDARFDIVDAMLMPRLIGSRDVTPVVTHVWRRLVASNGRARIAPIVRETGLSQKHLIHRLRHEIGLAPKTIGRVLRFGALVDRLRHHDGDSLAALAAAGGYYDQSHLTRDVLQFAGTTPGELAASLLPDRGGFVATGHEG